MKVVRQKEMIFFLTDRPSDGKDLYAHPASLDQESRDHRFDKHAAVDAHGSPAQVRCEKAITSARRVKEIHIIMLAYDNVNLREERGH